MYVTVCVSESERERESITCMALSPISWLAAENPGKRPLARKRVSCRAWCTLVAELPTFLASASAGSARSKGLGTDLGSCPLAAASEPCATIVPMSQHPCAHACSRRIKQTFERAGNI